MCGITGFISQAPIYTNDYYQAHRLIKHRGPDDEGFIVKKDNNIAFYKGDDTIDFFSQQKHICEVEKSDVILGHRRLSILDLTEGGHQPYCFDKLSLVYNGEIFNYIELRDELIMLGYNFQTNTDTEVILKAYHKWGKDAFNRFNGMWALAIYNSYDKSLLLCRDRFGIKPLYYHLDNETLYFASEMKFITAFAKKEFNLNKGAVENYLKTSKISDSSNTIWSGISELEPSCYLHYHENRTSIKKYWECAIEENKTNSKNALEEFSSLFMDSVKLRMRSDVEVGSLLSGGLDSTTIVCTLKNMGLISGSDFKSFSAVFEENEFSEKPYIDQTVAQTNVDAHFIWPKAKDVEQYIEKILFHIETPFRSLAVMSQFLIYEYIKSKSNVKVLLNGQGADELFSGYSKHYFPHIFALAKKGKLQQAKLEFDLLSKNRKIDKKALLFQIVQYSYKRPFINLNKVAYQEITSSPLREYLKYDDRNSMAFGLETRVPFLDYRLVEFAMKLPPEYKINHFSNKAIVRNYAKDIIPPSVWSRKDKMGFISPQEKWQQNELNNLINNNSSKDWTSQWRAYCLNKFKEINQASNI